jgi:isochorismate synthase
MLYFKLPFKSEIFSTDGNTDVSLVNFTSFDENEQILIKGNLIEKPNNELNDLFNLKVNSTTLIEETKEEYTEKLKNVIAFIKENKLEKLVISRRKLINYSNINLKESFKNLCKNYPNAFVYLFEENGVCWMGAFSEILGKFNKENSEFETMSLAGTLPINENWSNKEIEEQKTVTNYIRNLLQNFSSNIEESETYNHISGNIKHLRSDFKTKLDENKLEKLISKLHPTPAVCGFPKDFCKNAIQNFEKYPREFYAGFSRIETQDFIYYFVNLRCGKFYKNQAQLFVGGGITAESTPEKEWQETEMKAEAIAKNLALF